MIGGLIFGLSVGLSVGLSGGLSVGLSGGLIVGLIVGLGGGLDSVIQHYVLRAMLNRVDILPHGVRDKRLTVFLDTLVERIFLRRTDGGWQFVHLYLRDYFAELSEEEIAAIAQEVGQSRQQS